MFFSKSVLTIPALLFVGVSASVHKGGAPDPPVVFTATRVFNTLTDVAPYFVTATTTVTWTQSPSTTFAFPTGSGIP
ncbi:hypothetical protein DFH07DRAFT_789695 [Mycena maculata]|uniref:Uncharacterized protein n=1 Tax=Mycena maculata TaxID=230809 RepID=A0AAD7KG80_9AGAR|nr:hypothetical protein DFH07DRAFT_789695 [Mycena maculata]